MNFWLLVLVSASGLTLSFLSLETVPFSSAEADLFDSVWRIMSGHLPLRFPGNLVLETVASLYSSFVNLFFRSGINFPQGVPSLVTFYYGHLLGWLLYAAVFVVAVLLLQEKEPEVRARTVIFSVLYFGSVGIFENTIRLNAVSLSVLLFLNYIWLSREFLISSKPFYFSLVLDVLTVSLALLTNIAALILVLPAVLFNVARRYLFSAGREVAWRKNLRTTFLYIFFFLSVVTLVQVLPPPLPKLRGVWGGFKNFSVQWSSLGFSLENSWRGLLFLLYDLAAEYLGFPLIAALTAVLLLYFYLKRNKLPADIGNFLRRLSSESLANMDTVFSLLFIFYLSVVGIFSPADSAWVLPLGLLAVFVLSAFLEKIIVSVRRDLEESAAVFWPLVIGFLFLSVSLQAVLFLDLVRSGFPKDRGTKETYQSLVYYSQKEGIGWPDFAKQAVWLPDSAVADRNFTFPEGVKYVLLDYRTSHIFYPGTNRTAEEKILSGKFFGVGAFIFPSLTSGYSDFVNRLSWKILGVNWAGGLCTLVEPEFVIAKLKR